MQELRGIILMKKIYAWEPWFFMFFGVFHLHRIVGFFIALGAFVFCLGIKLLKRRRVEI